ncbi:hypothetical protein [Arthrobacter methylotrophus]|uniref:hypothetical protein n=1 Tax=Arthrobacter methylotrophus TaxID=121291 RepID=UPI0031E8DB60
MFACLCRATPRAGVSGAARYYGKPLADKEFLAVGSGYRKILEFITSHGTVTALGVEGTGSYGPKSPEPCAVRVFVCWR